MSAVTQPLPAFVELPAFARHRQSYLDDDAYFRLQLLLAGNPHAGPVISGTGGLRKLRFEDGRRGKGKRGGLRVIYYFWVEGLEFWLFTLYDKSEMSDLSPGEREIFRALLDNERARRRPTPEHNP